MAAVTDTNKSKEKVYATLTKGADLQLRVKVTWIDGLEFVNLRDYIPSTGEDGKGILFPLHMLPRVLEELAEVERQRGTGRGRPGSGQGKLTGV